MGAFNAVDSNIGHSFVFVRLFERFTGLNITSIFALIVGDFACPCTELCRPANETDRHAAKGTKVMIITGAIAKDTAQRNAGSKETAWSFLITRHYFHSTTYRLW